MNTKTILIAMLFPLFMLGQNHKMDKKREQIESQKIAFITKELELTPEEAQEFWPVYNQYAKERRENLKQKHDNIKNIESMSEEEAKSSIDSHIKTKEVEIEIESEYFNKFTKILGFKRTVNLLVAEAKFKKELLHRIRDRKGREYKTDR